jgi:hypothetical protein
MSQNFITLTPDQIPSRDEEHPNLGHGRRGSTHEPLFDKLPAQGPASAKAQSASINGTTDAPLPSEPARSH